MSDPKHEDGRGEQTLRGTVRAFNFAPKGEIDGLLLDVDGQVVQVNIPPDRAEGAEQMVGHAVELRVGPEPKVAEHPKGDHPVHKFLAFQGESPSAGAEPKPGPERGHEGHGHAEPVEVRGRVERLNYAKHGEANGVVLDTGDFVHLKPDGMKAAALEVGHEVSASGKPTPSRSGRRAIEARVVNGLELGHKKPRR